jgi:hypothetical protein
MAKYAKSLKRTYAEELSKTFRKTPPDKATVLIAVAVRSRSAIMIIISATARWKRLRSTRPVFLPARRRPPHG